MYNNFLQVANFFCGKSGERIFFGFIGSKEVDTFYYESQGVLEFSRVGTSAVHG
jgi:hypothetical protein